MPRLPDSSASLWFDRQDGWTLPGDHSMPTRTDVAVVGAGVSGLVAALELARAGVDVTVVEAGRVAGGASGSSSAKVAVLHALHAGEIEASSGPEAADAYVRANVHGLDWIRDRVRRRGVDCEWSEQPALTYTTRRSSLPRVEAEQRVLRRNGVEASVVVPEVPFAAGPSVRVEGQGQFDPVAFLRDVAEECVDLGVTVVEGTRARGLEVDGADLSLRTDAGVVRAGHVLVATGLPFVDRTLHFARVEPESSYVVACEVERDVPEGMYLSADGPTRSMRTATGPDGQPLLLMGGESHKTGQGGSTRARYRALLEFADEHFGVRRATHRFMTEDFMSPDLMPFAGPVGRSGRLLVATGYSKWGFTNAVAAAAVDVAAITGAEPPLWAAPFAADRLPRSGVRDLVTANANVALHMAGGWLNTLVPRGRPGPSDGRVVSSGIRRVAVSVDDDGTECRVSGVCPHLGAILTWNDAEQTWDCPLHGSRFDRDGTMVHGPAVEDLQPEGS